MKFRGDYLQDDEQFFIFRDRTPVRPSNAREILKNDD